MIVTIDIAHPPLHPIEAERILDEALRKAKHSGKPIVLKIVHGYGSSGKGGALKTLAANWAYTRRGSFSLVAPGEKFSPFDSEIEEQIKRSGLSGFSDLGDVNEGVTILFLK
jgi:hypothetical protein